MQSNKVKKEDFKNNKPTLYQGYLRRSGLKSYAEVVYVPIDGREPIPSCYTDYKKIEGMILAINE